MKKLYFQEWLFYVVAWSSLTLIFSYTWLITIRYFIDFFQLHDLIANDPVAAYFISDYQVIEGLLFDFSFGTFFFFINLVIDTTNIHKLPFGAIIFLKSLMYMVAVFIVFLSVYFVLKLFRIFPDPVMQENKLLDMLGPELMSFFLLYFIFGILLINFISQVNKKFGAGNLLYMILGRYHHPQIEFRIFLFIDLKDSTTIAEKLGHIKYSRLLQAFFLDLNHVMSRYHGHIYQYVGDEAVITWRKPVGLKDLNCIRFYYAFRKRIERRSAYYLKRFELVPEFKAGIHMGEVTAAEVGINKKEIAYHGDVLNTASRIQQLCNEFGKPILATKTMVDYLPRRDFNIQLLGEKRLKGKAKPEKIYSID
jgi:adenylate cyclase